MTVAHYIATYDPNQVSGLNQQGGAFSRFGGPHRSNGDAGLPKNVLVGIRKKRKK